MESQVQVLRQRIVETEDQLRGLKLQLEQALERVSTTSNAETDNHNSAQSIPTHLQLRQNLGSDFGDVPAPELGRGQRLLLETHEYRRYGRQLVMPEVGLPGQIHLKNAKVLIIGVGGLGCPAAAYLTGAGVGEIGLVDGDAVEASNLHRQIAHTTDRIGLMKVDSACEYLKTLNPCVAINRYPFHLSPEEAISIFKQYDLVLDCTDHPTSRYLISDACVLTGKPLVTASALKTEGQLIILNDPPHPPGTTSGGPCYRCIFPKPPPVESVISCGEGGILGPVVGVMGVLQALEALKLLTRKKHNDTNVMTNGSIEAKAPPKTSMLMFSAYSNPQFRSVRLRARRNNCDACSGQATVTEHSLTSGSLDYIAFCGGPPMVDVLPPDCRVPATEFAKLPYQQSRMVIDTRDPTQYAIAALPNSINVPWTGNASSWLKNAVAGGALADDVTETFVVCRLGNDSQLAAKALMDSAAHSVIVRDLKGGLRSWRESIDPTWPDY